MSAGLDAVIIGSGFGGAVSACRLAEKGRLHRLEAERGFADALPFINKFPERPLIFNVVWEPVAQSAVRVGIRVWHRLVPA